MQKALKVSNCENKNKLTDTIINNIDKLNDKKLVFKWKQIASESTGKTLSFPLFENNFGNYSQNISPNTSFNSVNSNLSNNSRNSMNNNNLNPNNMTFNKINFQNTVNNNIIFNNSIHNKINVNDGNNNFNMNMGCPNSNMNHNVNQDKNSNYVFFPKNMSKSYTNSPVNMRNEHIFQNFNYNINK